MGGELNARERDSMSSGILTTVFRHHAWSNLVLIDFLAGLTEEQLNLTVPGTYGNSIDTIRT